MSYPETVNLPFNGEIIRTRFTQMKPDAASADGPGYWVLLQGDTLLLREGDLHRGELPEPLSDDGRALRFGAWDGAPVRVFTLARDEAVPQGLQAVSWTELPDQLATLYGVARQILHWEKLSRHCSRCGSGDMTRIAPTWGKRCGGCGHEHYPHIHPCVIVLIRRGEEFLLARKPEWAEGRYSLVAGFVDFGESLEECVAREVFEETGLKVSDVRYVGSQNWPFPSQLMAGFVARYESGEIAVEEDELEDARWFTRERMPPALPPKRSIARWIIDNFALGDSLG
ncbi:NAD(+) diphosphatase [Geomonas subterranea]|uniref:NAD(+) diphosphatase n=1 Tax=Geomonas subterranea TaxID=2847989 RepID=A0ABX8LKG2_9BACT|nr:NAD(+) diphosphatase [Geomonas subterranea]QXE92218.1 NAD(+) diphosphatase [Geomonas subterranea]QXM09683.1 NAD(+) diphosphatase [Geomonas subterranea]